MTRAKAWRRPVVVRGHGEGHRQASWLELLFDLSFVIAVAQAARELEHALAAGHAGTGVVAYFLVFAAIWWAWMAFTWFANFFDTDDVPYRVLSMVMIAGALGLAAGVPRLAELDFRIGVTSYVVMRLAYLIQWGRVLRTRDPVWRPIATKIIVLTTISQIGWVLYLGVPLEWRIPAFVGWFALDLATPLIARWDARLGGHRGHIVERYGLFTLIVLGESIAAATVAIGGAVDSAQSALPLLTLAAGGLIVVFSLWWIYFDFTTGRAPERDTAAQYIWGYGHYFLFAAIAAIGAGLTLCVGRITDPAHVALADAGVVLVVAVPVAAFLLTVALIELAAEHNYERSHVVAKTGGALFAVGAAFAAPFVTVPGSVVLIGLMLASMVVYGIALEHSLFTKTERQAL